MFTPDSRARLRDALIAVAHADERVSGAALTGSASVGREDQWSDIDLALAVAEDREQVVADWTDRMYRAIHHLDLGVFRVFLLPDTLQVDIAFWPEAEFGPTGPTFRTLFGMPHEPPRIQPPSAEHLMGMAWLYGLPARSSIARGRVWQAEYMISGARDQVLALACLRHGVPAVQGRGVDDLPAEVVAPFADTLVRTVEPAELRRAFGVVVELLLAEAGQVDVALAARLSGPLRELVS
ncbi:nucleotidyltransferase domain-containing protein [Amycolatopsis thermalba]|uniref:nucleotidyltransferase domain-containing protein n=1 Tax=Amycolatopsis thermalba TaxID=944492 RepID=UPI000E2384F6|nr:nucleotidyltransferase domain-containing protein [Amycolatopsis thermalba]